jgi:hypothetical protein
MLGRLTVLALLEVSEYNPQSSRRHRSPMALVDGRLLLRHQHLAVAWLELMAVGSHTIQFP